MSYLPSVPVAAQQINIPSGNEAIGNTTFGGVRDNLLTPNQASIETDATGWVGQFQCTIARSTAQSLDGAASLAMTSTSSSSMQTWTPSGTSGIPVIPGQSYTAIAYLKAATITRNFSVNFSWYTSSGSNSSHTQDYGSYVADNTASWTPGVVTATAPYDAAFCLVGITVNSLATSEVHYVDQIGLFKTESTFTGINPNLITNSDFEQDLAGWNVNGPSTLTMSSDRSWTGLYSAKAVIGSAGAQMNTTPYMFAGVTYTLSAMVYAMPGSDTTATLQMYDNAGGTPGVQSAAIGVTGQWVKLQATLTATHNGNGYAEVIRTNSNIGTYYVDAVKLEIGSTATQYVPPSYSNLIAVNPGGQTSVNYVSYVEGGTNGSINQGSPLIVAASSPAPLPLAMQAQCPSSGTSSILEIITGYGVSGFATSGAPGTVNTFSVWIKSVSGRTVSLLFSGFSGSSANVVSSSTSSTASGNWQRISITTLVDPSVVTFQLRIQVTSPSPNEVLQVQALQIDIGNQANPYVDGAQYGGGWDSSNNLLANPSFETNTTGWTNNGAGVGNAIARSTTVSQSGTASLALTPGTNGSAGATVQQQVAPNTTYGASSYVYGAAGTYYLRTNADNMLSPNQASLETDTVGWGATGNSTIARSTTQFLDGVASLAITSVASGNMYAATSSTGVAVVPGQSYTASFYAKAATVGRAFSASIEWRDGAGAALTSTAGTYFANNTTSWTQAFVTSTAPSGAVYADIVVTIPATGAAGEVHYIDQISLTPNLSATSTINPNLVSNSDFEQDTTGLSSANLTSFAVSTDYAFTGRQSIKCVANGVGTGELAISNVTTIIGQTYTFSAWTYQPVAQAGGGPGVFVLGSNLGEINSTPVYQTVVGAWVRSSVTFTAKDTSTNLYVAGWAAANGYVYYADAVKLEIGSTATQYVPPSYSNLVSADPSFENGVGVWAAGGQNNSTLTSDTTQVYSGAKSLKVVSNASGAFASIYNSPTIYVNNGQTYTFSAWLYLASGCPPVTLNMFPSGVISTTPGASVSTTGQWIRATVTQTAISNGFINMGATATATAAGQTYWVDAVQIDLGNQANPYIDGAQYGSSWDSSNNLLSAAASSFEDGSTGGWVGLASTIANSTTGAYNGTKSLAATSTAASGAFGAYSALIPVVAGQTYTASIYASGTAGRTLNQVTLEWHNAGIISASTASAITLSSTPTRVTVTGVAPATTTGVLVTAYATSQAIGDILYVDAIQVEQREYATPYGAAGVANATTSTYAPIWTPGKSSLSNNPSIISVPAAANTWTRIINVSNSGSATTNTYSIIAPMATTTYVDSVQVEQREYVTPYGSTGVANGSTSTYSLPWSRQGASLTLYPNTANRIGEVIKLAPNQIADSIQIQNSAGVVIGGISNTGNDYSIASATSSIVQQSMLTGDSFQRFTIGADGKQNWGSGALATDTNLYRNTANTLKTDGAMWAVLGVRAQQSTSTEVFIGNAGPSSQSGISFQNGEAGSNLYRQAAGILATDGTLFFPAKATAATLDIRSQITGDTFDRFTLAADGKMSWGTGNGTTDTNLYRNSPAEVRTDGYLEAALDIFASHTLATAVRIGRAGPASQSGISFQNGEAGSNLYRRAAGVIHSDGYVEASQNISAQWNAATNVDIGLIKAGTVSGIAFQNAEAGSNLYRSAAGTIKTDGAFIAVGNVTAATFSGSGASLTSIPNAALVNSSVTISPGTGLSGGGATALGASSTLSLVVPVAIANGGTGSATQNFVDLTTTQTVAGAKTFSSNITSPALIASGLTGAVAASRYAGATASGAPTTGTFAVGDLVVDQTGGEWICTTAGTPGKFTRSGSPEALYWMSA